MTPRNGLVRITSTYFCAGAVLSSGVAVRAAPILRYMIGWSDASIRRYCHNKGWQYVFGPTDAQSEVTWAVAEETL